MFVIQARSSYLHQRAGTSLTHTTTDRLMCLFQTRLHAHHFFLLISFISSISRSRSTSSLRSRASSLSAFLRVELHRFPSRQISCATHKLYVRLHRGVWAIYTTASFSVSLRIPTICFIAESASFYLVF